MTASHREPACEAVGLLGPSAAAPTTLASRIADLSAKTVGGPVLEP